MYEYRATLLGVVDGDTLDVSIDLGFDLSVKQRIRLKGIDAPETRTRDLEEKARGIKAKDRLIELLPPIFVLRTFIDKKEKYGRILGEIFDGDACINQVLLDEGLVQPYM